MMEFTTVSGNRVTFKMSSITYFRELKAISKLSTRVFFSGEVVDLDISYEDFKGRLEDESRRQYYNTDATRRL